MEDGDRQWKLELDLARAVLLPGRINAVIEYAQARRRASASAFDEALAQEAGDQLGPLLEAAMQDERFLALFAVAVQSALRATSDAQARAIGRALASGLMSEDDTAVDIAGVIIPVVADLEMVHVRALHALLEASEQATFPDVYAAFRALFGSGSDAIVQPILAKLLQHGLIEMGGTIGGATKYERVSSFGRQVLDHYRMLGADPPAIE
jgi:hypothetical protein